MPQRFGRFWLHEKIGHGGMAEIFRATMGSAPNTAVFDLALKRLHPRLLGDRAHVAMFLTEADVGQFLRHPNLIQVFESGMVEDNPFIAMEYVWGIDLARLSQLLRPRGWRFPSDLAVYVAMQVLRGLDYIHRAIAPGGEAMEMIHRDITPANIYVTFNGEVKVGDFGIARVSFLEPRDDTDVVQGKVSYLPPEVLHGAPVQQRDDVWSLCITLYELLAGRPAYGSIDEEDVLAGEPLPKIEPIHEVNPEVDRTLSEILGRALHPSPKRRPQTAATLYRALKMYLRIQGIQVGAEGLARFVVSAVGSPQMQPKAGPVADFFEAPQYYAPVGASITQRFEVIRRKRVRLTPIWVVTGGLLIGAAILWFGR